MIESRHSELSINEQCELLGLPRSTYYYEPQTENEENLKLMRLLDELHLNRPFYGSRQLTRSLRRSGYEVNRKRVRRLMQVMGIEAIYPKPRTTCPGDNHVVYPYLLDGLPITRPNQVWCSDITYIPMELGFLYLVAIMDWFSRYVITWEVSNSLDAEFCVVALEHALSTFGPPEIFNTDQGSQFTSQDFTGVLLGKKIRISMDGRGRAFDNIFIERLWRTVKYEEVYLRSYNDGFEARRGLAQYFPFYNTERPHSSLGGCTPKEVYVCQ
jgi:putative transposase